MKRWAGFVVTLVLASTALLEAQERGFRIEARAGTGLPVGELAEIVDAGPAVGLSAVLPLSRRFALKVDASGEFFGGLPSVQAYHYLGGVEVSVLRPARSPWSVVVDATVGGTSFGREAIVRIPEAPPPRATLLQAGATVGSGLRIARVVADRLELFGEGRWVLMLTDADDVQGTDGTVAEGFGSVSSVPVMLGVTLCP